ncbi:type I restriction enzyme, S subunit [Kaistella treverensis]|uniref:Type I restriction enzyme, S subunit n=1 Tax=Kaistella treverensis TaxID=631455 RepID=A0A1I3N2S2_9FLAO|nr:restriction endonuclease subunit S [Kaistella treverensis]SFJ03509.1 type I restriction enzyme, S subunit [Kaistella treverensis]
MDNFKEVLVKDIAKKIQYGYTGKTVKSGNYKYLRITDIQNQKVDWDNVPISDISSEPEIEKYKLEPNDILFARTGATVGKSFLVEEVQNSIFASYLIRIKPKENIYPKFLYLFFQSENYWQQIRGHEVGAAQPNVNGQKLGLIKIPLPKMEIQKVIVSKLDEIFLKIDKSILLLEENLKHSKALLLSILDEEFGKLDCKQVEIGQILEKTINLNPITEFKEKEFTYIDITSINNVQYSIVNPKILKGKDAPSRAKKVVKQGDIVFATTRPNLKNIAIVKEDYINPIASTGFCVLRPLETKLNNEYLFYFLTSQKVQELITPFIKGAQYPAISDKDLLSIKIPLPNSISEQKKVVSTIKLITDTTNNFINEIQIKLDNLKALKSSLLDQAFKGEL